MTVMSAPGRRLVAFRDTAVCDRKSHEVAIVTDGHDAYAWGLGSQSTDAGAVLRVGVTLVAICGQVDSIEDDPCEGRVFWQMDTEGCWGADGDALTTLDRLGKPVER